MKNYKSQLMHSGCTQTDTENGDLIIALHCAGGNAKQWRGLAQATDKQYELATPGHYGTTTERIWPANKTLTMADEAQQCLQLIDQSARKVHLVGHSYGGALALSIALARHERIASISLYEPCAFHILLKLGVVAAAEMSEIATLAALILQHTAQGDNCTAMQKFVNYWSGEGAWQAMQPEYQDNLTQWAPNAVNAFDALFTDETPLSEYQKLNVPVQILQGGSSPDPVRMVALALSRMLPDSRLLRLPGVGHMGPLTHADMVNRMMVSHIETHSSVTSVNTGIPKKDAQKMAVAA